MSSLVRLRKKLLKMLGLRKLADRWQGRDPQRVFTRIYRDGAWGGKESISGPGSDAIQTRGIIAALPKLLETLSVESLLDVPCGDWNWMQAVDLGDIHYVGGDIVADLVDRVAAKHAGPRCAFRRLDLIRDPLPKVDLILCRDCLVHLSHENVRLALTNIIRSSSKYLLTTHYPTPTENRDIATGRWRPLNFQLPPFSFPAPRQVIIEGCTERDGAMNDKTLALWSVADIAAALGEPSKSTAA